MVGYTLYSKLYADQFHPQKKKEHLFRAGLTKSDNFLTMHSWHPSVWFFFNALYILKNISYTYQNEVFPYLNIYLNRHVKFQDKSLKAFILFQAD